MINMELCLSMLSNIKKRTTTSLFGSFVKVCELMKKGNFFSELLITAGQARVNAKDNKWLTPLHRACRSQSEVKVFLSTSFQGGSTIFHRGIFLRQTPHIKN